jgi:hypothetical protein
MDICTRSLAAVAADAVAFAAGIAARTTTALDGVALTLGRWSRR